MTQFTARRLLLYALTVESLQIANFKPALLNIEGNSNDH